MCHKKNIFHSKSYMFLKLSIISNTGLRKFPPPENSAPENSFLGNFPLIYFPPRKIPPMENSPLGKIPPKRNFLSFVYHVFDISFMTANLTVYSTLRRTVFLHSNPLGPFFLHSNLTEQFCLHSNTAEQFLYIISFTLHPASL